jgi:hypothetical protein
MITPVQLKRIHMLLNKAGEAAYKQDWVALISDHRVYSSKELSKAEADGLITALEQVLKGLRMGFNPQTIQQEAFETPAEQLQKLRRKVLYYCHQMQWYKKLDSTGTIAIKNGKPELDFNRIDNYCKKYSRVHKTLNEHTIAELEGKGGLVFQFYKMSKNTNTYGQKENQ